MLRLLLTTLLAALLCGCIERGEPDPAERQLLLSSADFASDQAPPGGQYAKLISYAERSIELSYRSPDSDWFYLYSGVTLHASASDALMSGFAESFGASYGLDNGGLEQQPLELSEALGSRASLKLLLRDGQPVGNLFVARVARKNLLVLLTGIYFVEAADFEALIAPKLALLRAYDRPDPLLAWAGRKLGLGAD